MRFPRMSGNAWVCTIIALVLLLAGTEQAIRALSPSTPSEPVQPPLPTGPQLGEQPPDFTLPDENGKEYTLAQYRGKPVIVSFFCGCSKCMSIGQMLGQWQKREEAQMIGLVTFKPEFFSEFREETGIEFPLVLDEGKEVGIQWDSTICPRLWVLDSEGKAVFTNPREPELLSPQQTAAMIVEKFKNPVLPTETEEQVAQTPESQG